MDLIQIVVVLFLIIVLTLAISIEISSIIRVSSLWFEIILECFDTIIRTCSFLLISFFTNVLSRRWKQETFLYWGEPILIPCLFIYIGISDLKKITNHDKRLKTIKAKK